MSRIGSCSASVVRQEMLCKTVKKKREREREKKSNNNKGRLSIFQTSIVCFLCWTGGPDVHSIQGGSKDFATGAATDHPVLQPGYPAGEKLFCVSVD